MVKSNRFLGKTGLIDHQFLIDRIILNVAKQRKQIIYGARSIQKQARLLARDTKDYDIFDNNPKKTAKLIQKLLDKNVGFDYYYMKPAEHKGTWKIKGRGNDNIKGTEDDESIADYTKPDKKIPFVLINGIRYRVLKEELKRKKATVQDPEFEFRHKKDRDDINRIKGYIKIKNLIGGEVG
jgi:hypothetical protein